MITFSAEIKRLVARTIIAVTAVGASAPLFSSSVDACSNQVSCQGYETHIVTQGKRVNVSTFGTAPLADWQKIPLGYGMTAEMAETWKSYHTGWGDRGQEFNISGTVNGTPATGRIFCSTASSLKGGGTLCSGEVNLDP